MTKDDLLLFFEARPSVSKRGFAIEAKIPERTFMFYLSQAKEIPEDRVVVLDKIMRTKYNYDYKESKVK